MDSTRTPWEELDIDDSDLSLSSFIPPLPLPKRPTLNPNHQTLTVKPSLSIFTLRSCSQTPTLSQPENNPESLSRSQTLISHSTHNQSHSQSQAHSLSPFSRLDSSSTKLRLIPGPAGTVQAAMKRRASSDRDLLQSETEDAVIPTQEYIRRAVEDGDEDDADFSEGPWLAALDFMRCEVLMEGIGGVIGTPLCSIKSGVFADRVDLVVAIVKSCSRNGLGYTIVTLKDPTGVIGASVHHRVLNEKEFGKGISVGAVLILQKVSVFSPTRCRRYLNITLNNIIKQSGAVELGSVTTEMIGGDGWQSHVISKDHYPLLKQKDPATESEVSFSREKGGNSGMPDKASSQMRGKIEGIMNSFRQGANRGITIHETNELEGTSKFLDASLSSNGSNQSYSDYAHKEPFSKIQNTDVEFISRTDEETSERTVQEAFQTDKLLHGNNEARSMVCNIKRRTGLANGEVSDCKGGEFRNLVDKKKGELVSRSSILQWTDEQLEQLLDLD